MSREERRAYQRQMKGVERGPAMPPGARERAERNAERRTRRRAQRTSDQPGAFSVRFWVRTILIAATLGYLGFSLQWSEGVQRAATVGLIVGGIALVLQVGLRLLQRRLPPAQP
jgi:hypothetical protein